MGELIGWGSAALVIPTFGIQTYKQWKSRNEQTQSSTVWFFVLALAGAVGQVAYSWVIGNWVYFTINVFLIVTDIFGLVIAARRPRTEGSS